uniref:Uncharacterized protein n=1 Tax=Anguilla anguilla TaxID=7936 RepID=A0A0E9S3P6_ANGAN
MQHVVRKFLEILASKQTFISAIPADIAPIQYPVHTYIVKNTRLIVFQAVHPMQTLAVNYVCMK